MRLLVATIIACPLLLAGALPAAATSAPDTLQLAADWNGDRDAYMERVRNDMREWERKAHDYGTRADDRARADLDHAWDRVREESHHLEHADANDWDRVRNSYERAVDELRERWDRMHER
jgi:hypothetical protein